MKASYTLSIPKGINPKAVRFSPEVEAELKRRLAPEITQTAVDEAMKLINKDCRELDIIMLVTMARVFGFGKNRLTRFYKEVVRSVDIYRHRYDDCDIFAAERELKEKGIDIDELENWMKAEMEENGYGSI